MHKYFKKFLLLIALGALALFTVLTFNLRLVENLTPNESIVTDLTPVSTNKSIVVGIVACGEKVQNGSMALLKSIILSIKRYRILSPVDVILFSDEEHLESFKARVAELQKSAKMQDFRFKVNPVIFPEKDNKQWRNLFSPCASQRLFFPTVLPNVDKILYLDADTLVLGNLQNIWGKFRDMSFNQVVGLVAENEAASWYNTDSRLPFYPPYGVNSGVMFMDLKKLRNDFPWEDSILSTYRDYKGKLVWADQDMINIIFHFKEDALYRLPCSFNYRTEHCQHGWNCETAKSSGIQILHGNRFIFHNDNRPVIRKLYQYFEKYDMSKDDYLQDIIIPFRKEFEKHTLKFSIFNLFNTAKNCEDIGDLIKF